MVYAAYYNSLQDNFAEIGFLQILSTIIVLNTFVPISLYVRYSVNYAVATSPFYSRLFF